MNKELEELIEYIESREKVVKEQGYSYQMAFLDIVWVKNRIKLKH